MMKENGYTFSFNGNGNGSVTVRKEGEDDEPLRFGSLREARQWAASAVRLHYRNLSRALREED
jgi:hypothetical protein